MRKFFIVLLSFITMSSPAARRYTMRLIDDGTMLFFFPCKLVPAEKGHSFVYDITYNTARDSVIVNMTYTALDSDIHSIRFRAGSVSYESSNFHVFYRELRIGKTETERETNRYICSVIISVSYINALSVFNRNRCAGEVVSA